MTDLEHNLKVGDRITSKQLSGLPSGSELRIINDQYPNERRRVLISIDQIWFGNKRSGGWQKNPLQPQHQSGVLSGGYGDFIIEKIAEPLWVTPTAISIMKSAQKNGSEIFADSDRPGAFYAVNDGNPFLWINDSGQWGGGFTDDQKYRVARGVMTGDFLKIEVSDDKINYAEADKDELSSPASPS